ncbi:hypothetical protein D3C85_1794880 [compost metagenome]
MNGAAVHERVDAVEGSHQRLAALPGRRGEQVVLDLATAGEAHQHHAPLSVGVP